VRFFFSALDAGKWKKKSGGGWSSKIL